MFASSHCKLLVQMKMSGTGVVNVVEVVAMRETNGRGERRVVSDMEVLDRYMEL
jgi:hypothetical protein